MGNLFTPANLAQNNGPDQHNFTHHSPAYSEPNSANNNRPAQPSPMSPYQSQLRQQWIRHRLQDILPPIQLFPPLFLPLIPQPLFQRKQTSVEFSFGSFS